MDKQRNEIDEQAEQTTTSKDCANQGKALMMHKEQRQSQTTQTNQLDKRSYM